MRTLLALPIVAVLLLAGCVTPGLTPAGTAPADPVGAASRTLVHAASGAPLALPDGVPAALGGAFHSILPASEPTIAATSDGAIYLTGSAENPTCNVSPAGCPAIPYAGFARGPTILRSIDGGLSWEDVYPKLPTGDSEKLRSWDPYVYVDRDTDRVFMDDIYPISCGSLAFSDDGGASWTRNPYACGNTQVNDHQTLFTAKPRGLPTVGYPNLVYRCVNNLAYVGCAISPNGGLSFLPQVPVVAARESGCAAITGHGESDLEGRAFLGLGCGGNPAVAVTEDDGQTWSVSVISEEVGLGGGHDVELGIDEAGNAYALWPSDGQLWFSASTDHGATWTPARNVTAPGVTATKFVAIAAGGPGKVAFSYVGTTHPGGYANPAAECGALPALPCSEPEEWANATWNGYVAIVTDALAADPVIQTTMANDPSDPLARGACADRCHGMTDFIEITIDAEGRPWSSFVDVCVEACVTDPTVLFDGNLGLAGTLLRGPSLRAEGELRALPLAS